MACLYWSEDKGDTARQQTKILNMLETGFRKTAIKVETWLETVFVVYFSPVGRGAAGVVGGSYMYVGRLRCILDITGMLVVTFRGENVDSCNA